MGLGLLAGSERMSTTRRRAPTMFQRRLILLLGIGVAACLVMTAQLVRLSVVEGREHRQEAESRLQQQDWIPTWRGTIFDRHRRPLAQDVPGYEVAVAWGGITGSWVDDQALKATRRDMGRAAWNAAAPEERERRVALLRPQYQAVLDRLWDLVAGVQGQSKEGLDRALDAERARIQHMAAVVWERQRQRHEARYGTDNGDDFEARPIAEQRRRHIVVPHLTDEEALDLQRFAESWPTLLEVRYARHRDYPFQDLEVAIDRSTLPRSLRGRSDGKLTLESPADQVLGRVRYDVWAEDLERRPFYDSAEGSVDRGGYRASDRVGARGLERGWEDQLRGKVGVIRTSRRTGEEDREAPVPGHDVVLTLDAMLQARVEAILDERTGLTKVQPWHGSKYLPSGTPLSAAAVVLDVPTGEILAMASSPSASVVTEEADQQARPAWINRATEAAYPPGSIIKPLIFAASVMEGLVSSEESIECGGHYFPERKDIARCWIYRPRYGMATHGLLASREALARSCNCYFYELGNRMGLDRLADWLGWFGIGRRLPIGMGGPYDESPSTVEGSLPDAAARDDLRASGEASFESVMMGIGQGRLTWTPLHAAHAYATLARGGRQLVPTIVRGHRGLMEDVADRPIDAAAVRAALDGLRMGVTEPWGTGSRIKYGTSDYEPIFTHEDVAVMGKTGTAQAPPWTRDVDGDGVIAAGERTSGLEHAWFVGLVGEAADGVPRYAVSVLVEYGGSGGRVAGPIANQIIGALKSEGYLGQEDSSSLAGGAD